jgi:hypothetical protein
MELDYFRNVRLNEDDTLLRVHASGQPVKHHFIDIFPKTLRAFQSGQSVNVHNTIDAVVFVLESNVILYRTHVVANMLPAGRASAGENAFFHLPVPKSITHRKQATRLKQTTCRPLLSQPGSCRSEYTRPHRKYSRPGVARIGT